MIRLALMAAALCALFLLGACGLPTNDGLASAFMDQLGPVTIVLVNDTGTTISDVRVMPEGGGALYVLGEMPPLDAASVGPLPLGAALVEWRVKSGAYYSQAIWIVLTNPVYTLRLF